MRERLRLNIYSSATPSITDSTCSATLLATTISKNESRKEAIINVLGGITGSLLVMIIILMACLVYLIVKYYRDVHTARGEGGEKGVKLKKPPSSDVGTQTINNDLIWQISTEENISYNLMANHTKKSPPSKQPPTPVVSNHFKSPTHDGKGAGGGKKSKRPPPIPKTEQISVSDSIKQFEKSSNPLPLAPKPTKIADLMKRFEN